MRKNLSARKGKQHPEEKNKDSKDAMTKGLQAIAYTAGAVAGLASKTFAGREPRRRAPTPMSFASRDPQSRRESPDKARTTDYKRDRLQNGRYAQGAPSLATWILFLALVGGARDAQEGYTTSPRAPSRHAET